MNFVLVGLLAMTLVACGGNRGLHDFSTNSNGPDAFSVLPNRALDTPEDMNRLPQPTPGGTNRADPNARADAIAALGGGGSNGGNDSALLAAAGRFGTETNIRTDLAEADASFRKIRGRLASGRGSLKYFRAYANMALDAYAELLRLRQAGVQTPSAPPR